MENERELLVLITFSARSLVSDERKCFSLRCAFDSQNSLAPQKSVRNRNKSQVVGLT
jgi:hypothetical protein